MVMNYFRFVVQETREWMAALGVRRIEDLIGRTEYLRILEGETQKQRGLDLSPLLAASGDSARFCTEPRNVPHDEGALASRMLHNLRDAIAHKRGGEYRFEVRNFDRAIG